MTFFITSSATSIVTFSTCSNQYNNLNEVSFPFILTKLVSIFSFIYTKFIPEVSHEFIRIILIAYCKKKLYFVLTLFPSVPRLRNGTKRKFGSDPKGYDDADRTILGLKPVLPKDSTNRSSSKVACDERIYIGFTPSDNRSLIAGGRYFANRHAGPRYSATCFAPTRFYIFPIYL